MKKRITRTNKKVENYKNDWQTLLIAFLVLLVLFISGVLYLVSKNKPVVIDTYTANGYNYFLEIDKVKS